MVAAKKRSSEEESKTSTLSGSAADVVGVNLKRAICLRFHCQRQDVYSLI